MKQPPLLLLNTHQHASDTHTLTNTDGGVCAYAHIHMYSLLFYLNKSIWQPKPQRSPMHGFTLGLRSQQNKLKALRESQKKWETERKRNRKREEKQSRNKITSLHQLQSPHCHLHTINPPSPPLPHPTLSPAPHLERNRTKWHYAYENVQKDVWFMYALDANSITGHKAGCEISHWTLGCPDQTPSH